MRERTKEFHINGILVLVLFGVFAVSILMVLLTGAGAYRRLTERGQESYTARTIPQYLSTRVRQADAAGRITVGMFDGVETLELREEIDGTCYVTRIYCYEGYLRELFHAEGLEFLPSDGECVMPAEAAEFSLQKQMLSAKITTEKTELELSLSLRSKEVAYEE